MKKQISVRMKKTLLERIDRFAESRQITRTQAVEMLLQSVLSMISCIKKAELLFFYKEKAAPLIFMV